MDTNSINKAYENMLNVADNIAADKDVSETDLSDSLKEFYSVVSDNEKELSSSSDDTSNNIPTSVVGSYDPVTGDVKVSDSFTAENIVKKISDKQFDMFTSSDKDINIDTDILSKFFSSRELESLADMDSICRLVKAKMKGERIRFDDLPRTIKANVLNIATEQSKSNSIPVTKATLNVIANLVIESVVTDYKRNTMTSIDLDAMLAGFNKDIDDMQNSMSKDIGNMYINTDETRKAELDAAIERCKAEGKTDSIERLEKMKKAIDDAYNLEDFSIFCKRVKIKNFDLEKPKRVFSSFNAKYEKHTNNINDISMCPMILDRHIKDDSKSTLKVCLAFCKYCMNMSPDNIEEHTFMYYFIRNIITIDRINPKGLLYDSISEKEKSFYDGFLSNIKKCITSLNER